MAEIKDPENTILMETTKGNVVPCCKECNTQKKQLLPLEWEAYLSRQTI